MFDAVQINRIYKGLNIRENDESVELEFFVRLCRDVLLEMLMFGERRRLTKLERIGRRFHQISENFFEKIPFLRLSIEIDPSDGTFINGLGRNNITLIKLTTPPPFVRFKNVFLFHFNGPQPVEAKYKLFESYLLPLKLALKDSNMISFYARIDRNHCGYFSDHTQLLEYLRTRLLPICSSSHAYKFNISLGNNSAPDIIVSLLQMPEIKRCSNFQIEFIKWAELDEQNQLPVEEISYWLEQCGDEMEKAVLNQNETERYLRIDKRYLEIYINILNAREMLDHLKTKFVEAILPVQPFNVHFWRCNVKAIGIKAQVLTNTKTGEEFSINVWDNGEYGAMDVKRGPKQKKR